MNRMLVAALAVILVLTGIWTIGYGAGIRAEFSCDDTADCEPPIAPAGYAFIAAGGFAALGGIGMVVRLRAENRLLRQS